MRKVSVPPDVQTCAPVKLEEAFPAPQARAGDFIENDSAVAASSEAAEFAFDRAGKSAAFVPKSSLSTSCGGRLAQSIFRYGASRRGPSS